jgi:PAS domain S-box-containing protein
MVKKASYQEELEILKEDLEDLKKYLDELKEVLPVAICTLTSFWVMADVNKAATDLTGYKYLEIIGQPVNFIFGDKKALEKIKKEAEEGKAVISAEMTLTAQNQKKIPVNISLVSRRDREENTIGYFLTIIDATEAQKYQNQLLARSREVENSRSALLNMLEDVEESRSKAEEEKNKTLAIITNFVDGLLVFDEENKLFLINPQAENFFNIKAKDIIGKSILELNTFPIIEPVVALIEKETDGVFRKEIQIKETLILEVSTISIKKGGEKISTLVILHDVTREKMIEKMKTEFVSISAHQLRTPLSAIKWTLRMLLDGDLGEISPEQKNFLEKTYNSNERMITLINDLLDVTRIEEGRYLYKPIPADFEPIVQLVINSYKEEFEKKKIEIWFNKPEKKLPQVVIDIEKIRLAVQNLLDNALRYTPPGGKVIVSLKYIKKEIEFSVQDTGVGIPEDQQGRIFGKFFRGANVLRMETEGSGLGLYITKNIIEAHGGKIWFESEEGRGSTFYFTIPVKEEFAEFLKTF